MENYMKKQSGNNLVKKLLIIRGEHIGDYVLSLPALRTIRENFPKARIDIVIGPWNKGLAKATPYINRIIIFDNPLVKRNLTYPKILKSLIFDFNKFRRFFRKINKEDYDLLISFSNRKYNKLFLKFVKAKKKISGTEFDFGEIKEKKRIKRLCEKINLKFRRKAKLSYSKKDRNLVDKFLKSRNLKEKNFFVLHPLSPLKEKDWPLEKWKEVLNKLNMKTLVIGTEREGKKIEKEICNGSGNIINATGKFNLVQTIYLISISKRFLGIDSGPMHLAELTDVPVFALFGPTNEKIWGPCGKKDKVIKKGNINDISVEEVLKEIK